MASPRAPPASVSVHPRGPTSARPGVRALLAALVTFVAPGSPGRTEAAEDACASGSQADPARAARLVAMAVEAGASGSAPAVCFASDPVEAGGVLVVTSASPPRALLPAAAPDARIAARLAHLALHVERPPFEPPLHPDPVPCARAVVRAAVREAEATTMEERLLARMGLLPVERSTEIPGDRGGSTDGSAALRGYVQRCHDR